MQTQSSEKIIEQIKMYSITFAALKAEISKVVVGHQTIIDSILIAILSKGHVLLEGVPGVAKTTLITTIANACGLTFNRIQFTPDLLPSDLIGTLIYNPKTQDFETKKGPVFAHVILADEINRSPAKVQSALLEAMQECQVTIGSNSFKLEEPFMVLATQNPIENEGTYQLPEAQIDRFMFKLKVGYPTFEQEREILQRSYQKIAISPMIKKSEIIHAQSLIADIYLEPSLLDYIIKIVFATRQPAEYGLGAFVKMIEYGASPRATINIAHAAKAWALLQNRHFVIPDDIKMVSKGILRHRIILTYHAQAEQIDADMIVNKILDLVTVP